MEIKKYTSRTEIPVEETWAIEDLFASDEAWEAELATLEADKEKVASFAGHLADSGEMMYNYFSFVENMGVKISQLANYCMRKADEDARVSKYQAMRGMFMGKMVALSAARSFETPEVMAISDEKLDQFYAEYPALERYRRALTNERRMKEHTLSPAEEKLLAASGEMSNAPDDIYGAFADADIKFEDAVDSQGNKYPLRQGNFVSYEDSADRVLRKSAYENLYDSFNNYKNTAAAILNAQNKQLKFYAEARKYSSAFEKALDRTNVYGAHLQLRQRLRIAGAQQAASQRHDGNECSDADQHNLYGLDLHARI